MATCVDTDYGASDSYGDPCSGYTDNPGWCNDYDDDDFVSSSMCCACGGGDDPTVLFAVDGGLNAPSWLIELSSADRYVWNRLVEEQL